MTHSPNIWLDLSMNSNSKATTARKVSGFCAWCGAVKIIPSHPKGEIAPPSVHNCEHH